MCDEIIVSNVARCCWHLSVSCVDLVPSCEPTGVIALKGGAWSQHVAIALLSLAMNEHRAYKLIGEVGGTMCVCVVMFRNMGNRVQCLFHGMATRKRFTYRTFFEMGYEVKKITLQNSLHTVPQGLTLGHCSDPT